MSNIGSFVCSLMRDKDDALARAHSNLAEVDFTYSFVYLVIRVEI